MARRKSKMNNQLSGISDILGGIFTIFISVFALIYMVNDPKVVYPVVVIIFVSFGFGAGIFNVIKGINKLSD